jgi:hypothetical protein
MNDMPPMRPVSVPPDEPDSASPWLAFAVIVGIGIIAAATAFLDDGSRWAIVAGSLSVVVGALLTVFTTRRVRLMNRGRRIPVVFGSAPVRKRNLDLMNGAGVSLAVIGAMMFGRGVEVFWLPILIVGALLMVYQAVSIASHNRRLTTISDA